MGPSRPSLLIASGSLVGGRAEVLPTPAPVLPHVAPHLVLLHPLLHLKLVLVCPPVM